MKKFLLMIIFLAFTCMGVNAQNPWNIDGNNNVNTTHFLGTKNLNPVIFKTNDEERMRLINYKSFLGIGVQNPMASLHLHYQTDVIETDPLRKLLQLTTNGTGNAATNGFAVFSDHTTKEIRFKQQEEANIFIEGQNGGIVINSEGDIGIGIVPPPRQVPYRAPNLHTHGILFAGSLEASSAKIKSYINTQTLNAQSAAIDLLTGITTAENLRVENLLCANEVKVQIRTCWPDYVFSKNYNLMPLQELEQFVNENQHLPEIPSAAEVEENGIELGKMNVLLLKKIEELTLYVLDLQKQIDELKK